MKHQVLARKWRPHQFSELVGQQHIVKALSNALQHNRLHHAYLFTGTRGVGKTTLARILAKALNCEQRVDFEPCGQCEICTNIDEGRFLDLIELDAASHTGVDNIRDLLDNAQYAPNSGQYKVYLIDEVHMLSGSSFNALLKTLEEPPPHVKFLLATTDPQKIPVTVLSRCLQFNLKRLLPQQIATQMQFILGEEKINCQETALQQIARSADGSMRDALSLLDQAIVYGGGQVTNDEVATMLGSISQQPIDELLTALLSNNGVELLACIVNMSELSPDFSGVTAQLLQSLHRIALAQVHPAAVDYEDNKDSILAFAKQFSAEDIQLYYQIALIGQRDLPLAPDARSGFEMLMLRMLAFKPLSNQTITTTASIASPKPVVTAPKKIVTTASEPTQTPPAIVEHQQTPIDNDWAAMIHAMNLTSMTKQLADNCVLSEINDHECQLLLAPHCENLTSTKARQKLETALQTYYGKPLKLRIKVATAADKETDTPAAQINRNNQNKQLEAEVTIANDANVLGLKENMDARIITGTIKPI